jgi:hemerythrin-like domain-containing protein
MHRAALIIHDEHRTLAAVLHGLLYLVRQVGKGAMTPDYLLLGSMLHYIDAFPERMHHPKEDLFLFAALRGSAPETAALLDELHAQHVEGAAAIVRLRQSLRHCQESAGAGFDAFAALVERYAEFHWQHMRMEEDKVLPLAEKALTEAQWRDLDAAFADNVDPIAGAGTDNEFKTLFARIANTAPPPIGLGSTASR